MNRQRGVVLVELAIILPLLVVFVFGITELGRAIYQQQILSKSVAVGARVMSRSYEAVTVVTDSDGDIQACNQNGSTWTDSVTEARSLVIYAGKDEPVVPGLDEDSENKVAVNVRLEDDVNVCVVAVEAQTPFQGIFGDRLIPLTNIGMPTLNAKAEEVYIGE